MKEAEDQTDGRTTTTLVGAACVCAVCPIGFRARMAPTTTTGMRTDVGRAGERSKSAQR